jgi:hypothetical protein
MTTTTLNRRPAELTGWTNIIELGGALLGTPPAGEPQCRSQALVPDWAGDWSACGPLLGAHGDWQYGSESARVNADGRDSATRRVIVAAVIAKLEAGQ